MSRHPVEGLDQATGVAVERTELCPHAPPTVAAPFGARCQECGSSWNLRLCAACGHVGCCESQAGHARAHAFQAEHPVIYQLPLAAGSFVWCYAEDRYVR